MVRERAGAGPDHPDGPGTPMDQLARWRDRRSEEHTEQFVAISRRPDDTVEFAAVPGDQLEPVGEELTSRRRRPRAGLIVGGGVVCAALLLSALASLGIGPVRDVFGDGGASSAGSGRQASDGSAATSTGSRSPSSGRTGPAVHRTAAVTGPSARRVETPPSAPRAGGPAAPAAGRAATGPPAPATGGRPGAPDAGGAGPAGRPAAP